MAGKFVTGALKLNGTIIQDVMEFTPVNLQWEDLEFDNLGSKFNSFNHFKLKETNGTIKLSAPLSAETYSQFWDTNNVYELMSTNVYTQVDESTLAQSEFGYYEIMRVVFGGVSRSAVKNGDGGEIEIPFKLVSLTILDKNNQETFYYNVITNALRLNGDDKRTTSDQLIGK